jgi:hypothetical protein
LLLLLGVKAVTKSIASRICGRKGVSKQHLKAQRILISLLGEALLRQRNGISGLRRLPSTSASWF